MIEIYVSDFAELIAAIVGVLHWKKYRHEIWRNFTFFLVAIVICEAIGIYSIVRNYREFNSLFYHFVVLFEFSFYFWLFFKLQALWKQKKIILFLFGLYFVSWIFELISLYTKDIRFYSDSYTFGNLLLLVCIISYFLRILATEQILGYKQDMLFWVSLGLLIYFLGSFPFYGLHDLLWSKYTSIFLYYRRFVTFLDILMYAMFSIGFIWGKTSTKS